ncbi:hypothetical protein BMS3Bbin14_00651 [bacterium BMS3Bbin14]|nr:hypothetical protein BMS3Abin13_00429 [bacterium BMS3Abin13]GBE52189.1 hypothetical protein BMS3Bbin14_00651 [bacterium BMS3Bbin14]
MNKRWKYFLTSALVLVLAFIVLLPPVLSSNFARRLILARLNERIPGELIVKSWLVGWSQGVLCRNITYRNPDLGIRVTIPKITCSHGLLELVTAPKNLGFITVDSPVVEITPRLKSGLKSGPAKNGFSRSRRESRKGKEKETGLSPWEGMVAELLVKDGQVNASSAGGKITGLAQHLELHSFLSGGVITFDLKFGAGDKKGKVEAQGSLNLPVRQGTSPETLLAKVDVKIADLQLKEILATAASRGDLPTGQGILNADFHLKAAGTRDFQVQGKAGLAALQLSGGFLGQDQPVLHNVQLALDCDRKAGRGWHLTRLDLDSDLASLHAAGEYGTVHKQLTGRAKVNLPVLFDLFPHLLRVRKDGQLKSGTLDLDVTLAQVGQAVKLTARARADQLGGVFHGRSFVWNKPVSLWLNGEKNGRGMRISRLDLEAPFIHARGRGNLSSFSLVASADLRQAFKEIKKFFVFQWSGGGILDLKATSVLQDDHRYRIDTNFTISKCILFHSGQLVLPPHQLSFTSRVLVPRSFPWQQDSPLDVQLTASSWPGKITLTAGGLQRRAGSFSSRYTVDAKLDLERVADLLQTFGILHRDTTMAGNLRLQASGFFDRGTLAVRELDGKIADFILNRPGLAYHDQNIRLRINRPAAKGQPPVFVHGLAVSKNRTEFFRTGAGNTAVVFPDHSLFLRNVQVKAALGKMTVKELALTDWQRPLEILRSGIKMDVDLKRLAKLLHGMGKLSPSTGLRGSAHLVFDVSGPGPGGQRLSSKLQLRNFSLLRRKKKLYSDRNISAAVEMQGRLFTGNAVIKTVALHSGALDLEATGSIEGTKGKRLLKAQGKLTPDLKRVASILHNRFGLDLAMTGRKTEAFILQYPLDEEGAELKKHFEFFTKLYAGHVGYMGLDLSDLDMPVYMEKGVLHMDFTGQVNGGTLDLAPELTLTSEPAVLTVPRNSRILTNVRLQKSLVKLLGRVHPLFGLLATPSGQLDVRLNSFSWPLVHQGGRKAAFSVVFDVSRVKLNSSPLLREVLSGFGREDDRLRLGDKEMTCYGSNGRITCSPVHILVAGSEMLLTGSVGMDQSLQYILQVPLTPGLVGREAYRVLKGTMVRVPIRGTIGHPAFDRNMVVDTVRDLVQHAAGRVINQQLEKVLPDLLPGVFGAPPQQ